MAEKSLATVNPNDAAIAAEAATKGDLSALSPVERTQLYGATCRSMGLNPLSRPFEYIKLNGKLTLYATRTATDQLRKINGVSITSIDQAIEDGVLVVTVEARDATGRTDMEIGAVTVAGLRGEALANARMKAITKAKRRVTLSISGLGWLDETEVATVPTAEAVLVDDTTGEIHDAPNPTPIRNARQKRQDAPERDESTESVSEPIADTDAWQKANKRLHKVAGDRGIKHESLSDWAFGTHKVQSLKDLPASELNDLADMIEKKPHFDAWLKRTYPGVDDAQQPQLVDVEPAGDPDRFTR